MFSYCAPPASWPEPRRRARSMLSLGTELFLAFWIASYSVGLPPGSPPPTRAATSMFLISRANILPRRASTTAFLCLVVAHLEWPLIGVLPLLSLSKFAQRVYVDAGYRLTGRHAAASDSPGVTKGPGRPLCPPKSESGRAPTRIRAEAGRRRQP